MEIYFYLYDKKGKIYIKIKKEYKKDEESFMIIKKNEENKFNIIEIKEKNIKEEKIKEYKKIIEMIYKE